MKWFIKCFKQYADFKGRARRKEYWMFALINWLIGVVMGLLGLAILSWIYSIAALIPGLAVGVRRLHDIGKSGWWLLIALVPIIGWIWLIVLCIQDSQAGVNEWGPNPKGEDMIG
ncbi:MAG: DUF805 domain-containing protein [Bacteroidales bacterium]|nr:DUF805 domain-containing protein [Bacteroidales bacterium]